MESVVKGTLSAYSAIAPEVLLVVGACGLFLAAPFLSPAGASRSNSAKGFSLAASLALLLAAALASVGAKDIAADVLPYSLFRHDGLANFIHGLTLAAGAVLVFLSWNQVESSRAPEYYGCLLLSIAGLNLTISANDLIALFLALELVSIPTYVLLYLPKRDTEAQEGATKYFLLSVFSSAIFLYGLAFLYGVTGTTNLEGIRLALVKAGPGPMPVVLVLSLIFVVAGLGFRVTAVPFHFYAPDVFQGTSVVGAAFLSYVPKIAGFGALVRLLTGVLLAAPVAERAWSLAGTASALLGLIALLTMFIGNLLALLQNNLKRMLAYSSVAHAGYMLVGLTAGAGVAGGITGQSALLFYLVIYGVMTLGAFAVLASLDGPGKRFETLDDIAGLSVTHPRRAMAMAAFMFSLTGLPPTAGFWGKLYLFFAAWGEGSGELKTLAVLLAINAAIGAWYYLRVIGAMYLSAPKSAAKGASDAPSLLMAGVCGLATIGLFLFPGVLWRWVEAATLVSP